MYNYRAVQKEYLVVPISFEKSQLQNLRDNLTNVAFTSNALGLQGKMVIEVSWMQSFQEIDAIEYEFKYLVFPVTTAYRLKKFVRKLKGAVQWIIKRK